MKTFISTIALLCFIITSSSVSAQKIRFTDSTNVWNTLSFGVSPTNPPYPGLGKFYYLGDTVVNSLDYKIATFGLVREDTNSKKVFIKNSTHFLTQVVDTNEYVMYDFGLLLGDTIHLKISAKNDYSHYVSNIDSVLINGRSHLVWHLAGLYKPNMVSASYYVIEGIGSANSPTFPLFPVEFERRRLLTCFKNKGITPPLNKYVWYFNNTTSCTLGILDTKQKKDNEIVIIPHPATEHSIMKLPFQVVSGRLTIVNTLGQLVLEKDIVNTKSISLNNVFDVSGIYFYKLTDLSSGKVFSGRVVYE